MRKRRGGWFGEVNLLATYIVPLTEPRSKKKSSKHLQVKIIRDKFSKISTTLAWCHNRIWYHKSSIQTSNPLLFLFLTKCQIPCCLFFWHFMDAASFFSKSYSRWPNLSPIPSRFNHQILLLVLQIPEPALPPLCSTCCNILLILVWH